MAEPALFERQILAFAAETLAVTPEENAFAIKEGYRALARSAPACGGGRGRSSTGLRASTAWGWSCWDARTTTTPA